MHLRVADLLGRLTLHEKVGMLFMDANMAYGNSSLSNTSKNGDLASTAVSRLGLPQFMVEQACNRDHEAIKDCGILADDSGRAARPSLRTVV